ncbi:MAG TPA: D-glycerate dehydrogenase [Solirubrobacterales bacterium]|nr:D-glycerate dehydrogenase [Solirubrobacterales bacterium]
MESGSHNAVLICRVLLDAGRDLLVEEGYELREGGLDASLDELMDMAPGCAAIVADPTVPIGPELLEAAGSDLRVVANFAVGYDNVDLDACRERSVVVTNTPGVLTNATAELALGLTVAAARRAREAEVVLREGRWTGWDPGAMLGLELSDATFGIVGLGRIGGRYAELVRPLAGTLLYTARSPKPDAGAELGATYVELSELLERSDVVSLHAPGGEQTRHLIGRPELEQMKAGAVLVNTARGTLVDSEALAEALESGAIGAAGLDVYEGEPDVPQALLDAPRCVLLPHIGSATHTSRDGMATLAARNAIAVLRGEAPLNPVS